MKAIVFDFDGVLADTYEFNKKLCKELGHDVSHEDFKAHHDGNCYEKPKIPFTSESSSKFFVEYEKGIQRINPFFTRENINLLKEISPLYIISSNKEEAIAKFLNYYNLKDFKEILGVNFHKSKIEKFNYLLKKYGLSHEEIIFVTDTLGDILEANKVNIKTIAVDFGYHEKERLEKGNPFKIVSNFNELVGIIEKLNINSN